MSLFPNELPHLTHRAMAEKVLKWLHVHTELGVSSENRLAKQCRLIIESEGIIQKTHPEWRIFVQSLKDLQEYWFILEVVGDRLAQSPLLDRLTWSLQDSAHPSDSRESTPGRNAQFELFLAAIAARAGLTVDSSGKAGADWILSASGEHWSLEAKRIKNLAKLDRHIKDAAKQVLVSRIGGVIAVDISVAVNHSCAPLSEFVPHSQIEKAHDARTNALVKEKLQFLNQWTERANVGFVLLHDFVIVPANSEAPKEQPWGLIGLWSKVDIAGPGTSNRAHFDGLWQLLSMGMPNPPTVAQ